ncbi:PREDICTED: nocturnin [Chinchilla lanigera]|uniref:nocturnin n=1 Tax=Chinchilla lanigera TaxID=34839 RepID=UPI00069782D8|nr:PREDICTED: nocturnin [Chinchilla lanigera]
MLNFAQRDAAGPPKSEVSHRPAPAAAHATPASSGHTRVPRATARDRPRDSLPLPPEKTLKCHLPSKVISLDGGELQRDRAWSAPRVPPRPRSHLVAPASSAAPLAGLAPARASPRRIESRCRVCSGTSLRTRPPAATRLSLPSLRASAPLPTREAAAAVLPGMYQSPRRLCSALLTRDAPGLRRPPAPGPRRRSPPPAAAPRPASPRLLAAAPAFLSAAWTRPRTVHSMGTGTSRLYSALAKTLNSSAASQHPEYLVSPDPEHLEPIDPKELLEECRAVLHTRPPRFQRDFVDLRADRPSSHPSIRVMQWNILAQALGEGKDNFVQCPIEALKWEERKCLILEEILAYQPDILCLQEVDHYFDTFQPLLSRLGYQGTFFPKPWSPCLDVEHNNGPDGCALFFLQNRFKLVNSANIRLTAMTLKTNQVAIAQTLECKESGRQFCIAVTHLKARTGWEQFRSAQGCDLLQNLQNITQGAKIPLIVCGDFNAEPTEEVYKHFASSSLNLNSAYKLLSADGQSEPPYTTWKIRTSGECRHTLDYIWYSQHALSVRSALDLLTEEQIGPNRLPSFNYPSDHLSLVCDFGFNEEPDELL